MSGGNKEASPEGLKRLTAEFKGRYRSYRSDVPIYLESVLSVLSTFLKKKILFVTR
jgi:hypothetical protein